MLNAVYRLVEPRRFEVEFSDVGIFEDSILVRPTHLSICNADQRYYQGKRAAKVLAEKLPMALIHEGIGEVIFDPKGEFKEHTCVVLVPNTPVEEDEIISENYLRSSKFRASGFDGFMQDCISMDRDRIIILPDGIDKNVAAFTELVSVSVQAINRFDNIAHQRRDHIGIWGDGNLAYITALLLKYTFPETELLIFGKHQNKLIDFTFADQIFCIDNIPPTISLDHAFECVGGEGAPVAINQIIDVINPEGTISILGVTESLAPINTRMILEKGLRIFGSSRSTPKDFQDTIELYLKHPEMVEYLEQLVGNVIEIHDIKDMKRAFDADIHKAGGKTIMVWKK